jgi:hypothetical protein
MRRRAKRGAFLPRKRVKRSKRLLNVGDAELTLDRGRRPSDIVAIAQNDQLASEYMVRREYSRLSARPKSWAQLFKKPTRHLEIRGLETFRETFEYTCHASTSFGDLAFSP